jgi:hypothetical protein
MLVLSDILYTVFSNISIFYFLEKIIKRYNDERMNAFAIVRSF